MLMLVLMTLTLMQGNSGSAQEKTISVELSRQLSKSAQFSSRWYLCARENPYAPNPVSREFAQCCLRSIKLATMVGLFFLSFFLFYKTLTLKWFIWLDHLVSESTSAWTGRIFLSVYYSDRDRYRVEDRDTWTLAGFRFLGTPRLILRDQRSEVIPCLTGGGDSGAVTLSVERVSGAGLPSPDSFRLCDQRSSVIRHPRDAGTVVLWYHWTLNECSVPDTVLDLGFLRHCDQGTSTHRLQSFTTVYAICDLLLWIVYGEGLNRGWWFHFFLA